MFTGIISILAATLCWGFIFVIPMFMERFDPIEVTLGRFFSFGLVSLIVLILNKRYLLQRTYAKHWLNALWLGLISSLVCYSGMVFCMRYASPSVSALIYGVSPILIALLGNRQKREYRYRDFLLPGVLTLIGITLTNLKAFESSTVSFYTYAFGFVCGVIGLFAWAWYAVRNAKYQEEHPGLPVLDWIVMLGVAIFCIVICIAAPIAAFKPDLSHFVCNEFLIGSLILGTICSWLPFYLWNRGTLHVPISLAGQLSIFETIFGLVLIYMIETRLPSLFEFIGIIALFAGVLTAFKTLKKRGTKSFREELD